MERRFFSGNTLEQAVMTAARHFGLEPEQVAYTQREKRHGFLKIRRRVVIEIDPNAPQRPIVTGARPAATITPSAPRARPPQAAPPPRRESRHASRVGWESAAVETVDLFDVEESFEENTEEATASTEEDAVELAIQDLARIAGLEIEWSARKEDEGYKIEFSGRDAGALLDEGGRFLAAVEHLVPRLVRSRVGHGVACKADCEGFQADHEDQLRRQALQVAQAVRNLGEMQLLEPMNPADRRVVHMALAEEPGVETESEGEGYYKRVKIMPVVE